MGIFLKYLLILVIILNSLNAKVNICEEKEENTYSECIDAECCGTKFCCLDGTYCEKNECI
jgi:hypothetical protein